jgi:hypothetical protein
MLPVILFLTAFANGAVKTSVKIPYKNVRVEKIDGKAVFKGATLLGKKGQPNLPGYTVTFLLPQDADLKKISIVLENSKEIELPDQYDVDAAFAPATSIPDDDSTNNDKDMSVYGKDAFFPASNVGAYNSGKMRQYKLLNVQFFPFRYNPVTKKLKMITDGELSVYTSSEYSSTAKANSSSTGSKRINNLVNTIAVNYDQIAPSYNRNASSGNLWANSSLSDGEVYSIITTSDIVSKSKKLQSFIESKRSRGFTVRTIDETVWGGGTGDIAAERLRSWLKSNYQTLDYVLLIGNPNPADGTVPMKMVWQRSDSISISGPTDLYYAELSGDWNADGDNKPGEFADDFYNIPGAFDQFAELSLGRIPYYNNIDDLDKILNKIVLYENSDARSSSWRSKVLLPMKPSDKHTPGFHLGEAIIRNAADPAGWKSTRVYEHNYGVNPENTPCSYASVLHTWKNDNFGLVIWWTHGGSSGAEHILENSHTQFLDDTYPSFTFQVSCSNAYPEYTDNLAYSILKNGGISTIAATRESYYAVGQTDFENSASNAGLSYAFANNLIKDGMSAGDALMLAKSSLVYDCHAWLINLTVFNIYGDPSLGVYTSRDDVLLVGNIPDQKKFKGEIFDPINLNSYLFTKNYSASQISWSTAGNVNLRVSIGPENIAQVYSTSSSWKGSEKIVFTATSPDGLIKSDTVTFTVAGNSMVYLSDLDWSRATIGWGNVTKDKSVEGNTIRVNNKEYLKGIGTHANSEIVYSLNKQYDLFSCIVGSDDESYGSVDFEIYGDGVQLYKKSGVFRGCGDKCEISVKNVDSLRLVVTDGGNDISGDHADWADAKLVKGVNFKTVNTTISGHEYYGCWEPAWDQTMWYRPGDCCSHNGHLWEAQNGNSYQAPVAGSSDWNDMGACPSYQIKYFGSLTPCGNIPVDSGNHLIIGSFPDYGFVMTEHYVDGRPVSLLPNNSIDLGKIISNRTVEVKFEKEEYGNLVVSIDGPSVNTYEYLLGNGNHGLNHRLAYVYALPVPGYSFVKWERVSGDIDLMNPYDPYCGVILRNQSELRAVYDVESNPSCSLSIDPSVFRTDATIRVTVPETHSKTAITFELYRIYRGSQQTDFVETFTKTLRAGSQTFTRAIWNYLPGGTYYKLVMKKSDELLAETFFEKLSYYFDFNLTVSNSKPTDSVTLTFNNPSPYISGQNAVFQFSNGTSVFSISKSISEGINKFTQSINNQYYPLGKYTVIMSVEGIKRDTVYFEKVARSHELEASLQSIDFGTIATGNLISETLVLTNSGNSPALISSIQVSEPFSVTQGTPVTVLPGTSVSFTVNYQPVAAGNNTANLLIVNAPDADIQTISIALSGKAEQAQSSPEFEVLMIPDADPSGNSIQPQFTLKNTGNKNYQLSDLLIEYYTNDQSVSTGNLVADIYYCNIPNAGASVHFSKLGNVYGNNDLKADTKAEISFTSGTIVAGAHLVLNIGIHTNDWNYMFNESDDWSHSTQGEKTLTIIVREKASNRILCGTVPTGLPD